MIIAVPYEDKQVFQHFGRTETFKVYEVNEGKITAATIRSTDGNSHGALVDILKNMKATVLICGGIGSSAQNALTENGIQFFGGVIGDADQAVADYLLKQLKYNPDVQCDHPMKRGILAESMTTPVNITKSPHLPHSSHCFEFTAVAQGGSLKLWPGLCHTRTVIFGSYFNSSSSCPSW
jgi:predicted Fe-Mo cluster-binding NifX family protein